MYIFIIIFCVYLCLCYLMFLAISWVNSSKLFKVIDAGIDEMLFPYKDMIEKGRKWVSEQKKEEINIKSYDNTKLHGIFIRRKNHKGVIILAHGYRSTKERDLYSSLYEYYGMGYSLLIIDQRGCGKSDGKYITFGYSESKDLEVWVHYVYNRFKCKIIVAGISLGASSALLVNNSHVNAIIEDSGFANAYQEINYCINHYFHIPGFIFMPGINFFNRIINHFSFKDVDIKKNLDKIKVPILFIHGKDDDFVPKENSISNYDYYKGPKELLLVDNAFHGMGYLLDRELYINKISEFLNNII